MWLLAILLEHIHINISIIVGSAIRQDYSRTSIAKIKNSVYMSGSKLGAMEEKI